MGLHVQLEGLPPDLDVSEGALDLVLLLGDLAVGPHGLRVLDQVQVHDLPQVEGVGLGLHGEPQVLLELLPVPFSHVGLLQDLDVLLGLSEVGDGLQQLLDDLQVLERGAGLSEGLDLVDVVVGHLFELVGVELSEVGQAQGAPLGVPLLLELPDALQVVDLLLEVLQVGVLDVADAEQVHPELVDLLGLPQLLGDFFLLLQDGEGALVGEVGDWGIWV